MSVQVNERTEATSMTERKPLVKLEGVMKHFPLTRGIIFQKKIGQVHAVDGVDLEINAGETLGLVGETGCGKSTLARLVMRLYPLSGGRIFFDGDDITFLKGRDLRALRRNMQMIFQDPYASLNPRKTVGAIIGEPFHLHGENLGANERDRRYAIESILCAIGHRTAAHGYRNWTEIRELRRPQRRSRCAVRPNLSRATQADDNRFDGFRAQED